MVSLNALRSAVEWRRALHLQGADVVGCNAVIGKCHWHRGLAMLKRFEETKSSV